MITKNKAPLPLGGGEREGHNNIIMYLLQGYEMGL